MKVILSMIALSLFLFGCGEDKKEMVPLPRSLKTRDGSRVPEPDEELLEAARRHDSSEVKKILRKRVQGMGGRNYKNRIIEIGADEMKEQQSRTQ